MFRRLNKRLLEFMAKRSGESAHDVTAIEADERGITVSSARDSAPRTIAWRDIDRVVAVRREQLTHAVVGMVVICRSDDVLEIHEGLPGWTRLAYELASRLPGALPFEAWYPKLAFSRHEPSSITLFPVEA